MLHHALRLHTDRLLAPLSRLLGPRVSPTLLTAAAFALGIACAAALLSGAWTPALLLWLGNRTLAGLDGTHARVHGRQSDFGGFTDALLDAAVLAAVPAAMIYLAPETFAPAGAFLLAMLLVNAASRATLSSIVERRQAGAVARGEITTLAALATSSRSIDSGETLLVLLAYTMILAAPSIASRVLWLTGALLLAGVLWRLAVARRRL